jgi:hypothetical protein
MTFLPKQLSHSLTHDFSHFGGVDHGEELALNLMSYVQLEGVGIKVAMKYD